MNGFDIAVVVVTGILVVLGLLQGVIRILVGMAAIVVAFLLASRFHQPLADIWVDEPNAWLRIGAYIAIFLGVMLAGGVVAFLLRAIIKAAMLGWADRLAGAALGVVATALTMALLIMPLVAYVPKGESLLADSKVAPYLVVISDLFHRLAPEEMRVYYRQGVEELRELWARGEDYV
jgi:membrane protein required for colicin V production